MLSGAGGYRRRVGTAQRSRDTTERLGDRIGRITPAGVITEFPLPTTGSCPEGDHGGVGPDGR